MKRFIPPSELILNPDGSIYHLNLHPDEIAPTIITVGDPERVKKITRYFDAIECEKVHREFFTQTGRYRNHRLTVISTGIGTDNIDIVLNEIDALINVSFNQRSERDTHNQLTFIRLGTSGAIQPDIPIGSIIVSEKAIGLDGLLYFYPYREAIDPKWNYLATEYFRDHLAVPPYVVNCNEELLIRLPSAWKLGITATAPGFYAPQGRSIRITEGIFNLSHLIDWTMEGKRVSNLEMETAGIYGLAKLLGHRALSINAILANRALQSFSNEPEKIVNHMIETALDWIIENVV